MTNYEIIKSNLTKYPMFIFDVEEYLGQFPEESWQDDGEYQSAKYLVTEHNYYYLAAMFKRAEILEEHLNVITTIEEDEDKKVVSFPTKSINSEISSSSRLLDVSDYINTFLSAKTEDEIKGIIELIDQDILLIKTILINLKIEINTIRKLLQTEDFSDSEREEFVNQLELLSLACSLINSKEETEIIEENESNELWFLSSQNNTKNSYFYNDLLKRIPTEYYDCVFDSLEKLKNENASLDIEQYFGTLKGVYKIKLRNGIRILFMTMGGNNILVLGVVLKKSDNPKSFSALIESRVPVATKFKKEFRKNLELPEFMSLNIDFRNQVYGFIEQWKKKRGGLTNGNN